MTNESLPMTLRAFHSLRQKEMMLAWILVVAFLLRGDWYYHLMPQVSILHLVTLSWYPEITFYCFKQESQWSKNFFLQSGRCFKQFSCFTLLGYSPRILAGIAECGNVLGLIGVISICSVQLVSRCGALILSTSTFSERCSNGQANVSEGNAYKKSNILIGIKWFT